MPTRTVTKHDFLTALGCKTRAWYGMRESGGAPTPADLLRMQEGQDVHRRAQSLHPNGVFAGSIDKTKQLILDRAVDVVFEAVFAVDGYAAQADWIRRVKDGWFGIARPRGVTSHQPSGLSRPQRSRVVRVVAYAKRNRRLRTRFDKLRVHHFAMLKLAFVSRYLSLLEPSYTPSVDVRHRTTWLTVASSIVRPGAGRGVWLMCDHHRRPMQPSIMMPI